MNAPRALLAGALALATTAAAPACSDSKERPPPATCVGRCGLGTGAGSGLPNGGGGEGNEGGNGSAGDEASVTFTGVVGLLLDDRFELADPFPEAVDLRAESATSAAARGIWTGSVSDPFEIEGVRRASAIWIAGTPRSVNNDALPTLELMRTDNPDAQGVVASEEPFVLARGTVMDQILGVLGTPVMRDEDLAQVVLQVVGGNPPTGRAGIQVTAPAAEVVIYATSNSWSEIPMETDNTGFVVLANVPASDWPGSLVEVSFSGPVSSSAEIRVIGGAVTIAPVEP